VPQPDPSEAIAITGYRSSASLSYAGGTIAASAAMVALGNDELSKFASASLDGDIAEFMVYQDALSVHEIDRIGMYLSTKYGLLWQHLTASSASGSVTVMPSPLLLGGDVALTITGTRLFPYDTDASRTCDGGDVSSADMTALMASVQVSVQRTFCPSTSTCSLQQWACTAVSPGSSLGTHERSAAGGTPGSLICTPPSTIMGSHLSVDVAWQGISTRFDSVFSVQPPNVVSVSPSRVPVTGGSSITVTGLNLGVNGSSEAPSVLIVVNKALACNSTSVSTTQLVCTVPALDAPQSGTLLVQDDATVQAQVVVALAGQRSAGVLAYVDVPTWYTCDVPRASSTALDARKDECFNCCRQRCFAQSATGVTGTYHTGLLPWCTKSCVGYCKMGE